MEDRPREVAPVNTTKPMKKQRLKRTERLTIMIFKSAGRVWSGKISTRLLIGAALFLACYIVGTIVLSYKYADLWRTLKAHTDERSRLTRELATVTKSLERSHHKIALLKDYIEQHKPYQPEPVSLVTHTESTAPSTIELNDIEVKRAGATLTVTFRIINKNAEDTPIGGYIFVLTRLKDSPDADVWVYPTCSLTDGLPVNYKQGHRFSIQRFIAINTTYTLSKAIDDPLILKILVYDKSGNLMVTKEIEG